MTDGQGKDRRKHARMDVGLPVRVQDGHVRLNLLFLDEPAPERLLPPIGADEAKGKP